MTQTYVALTTVFVALLTEIVKQLFAATHVIVGGIAYHLVDAFTELCLSFLIHLGLYLHVFHILTSLCITDIRGLLLRDEMQDMPLAQTL